MRNIFLRERMEYINFPRLGRYCTVRIGCIRASAAASRGLADGNVARARVDRVGIAMSVMFLVYSEIDVAGRTMCMCDTIDVHLRD